MFLIWTGILDELIKFMVKINQINVSIKIDFSYSKNSKNI